MADKRWKAVERRIAAVMGGERIPVTGRHDQTTPDIQHDRFAIECKSYKKLPAYLSPYAYTGIWTRIQARAWLGAEFTRLSSYHRDAGTFLNGLYMHTRQLSAPVRTPPAWLRNAFQQARTAGKAHNRIPLVVLHQAGWNVLDCICIRLDPLP